MEKIKATNLKKSYGDLEVLKSIDLQVQEGVLNSRPGCAAAVRATGGAPIAPGIATVIFPNNYIPPAFLTRRRRI